MRVTKAGTVVLIGPFPYPIHGVSIINAKLAEKISARGVDVRRVDLSPGQARGATYHVTRMLRALFGFISVLFVFPHGCTVMHTDGGVGIIYNILLALGIRLSRRPLFLYHHSTHYVLTDSTLMRFLLFVAGPDVRHIFCSQNMAALFQTRYAVSGAAIIVNNAAWINLPDLGRGSQGALRLGFLSTLTLEKGVARSIQTLRQLRERGFNAELGLAGAIIDEEARELVENAKVEFGGALSWCGVLEGAAKDDFYRTLDVFLFPSLYPHETQSLVVPEALAAGTPVVAYDHRFIGEILGSAGLLVPVDHRFAETATDWIAAGPDEWPARRAAARRQFEAEALVAAGQIDRLISWAEAAA